MWRGASFARPRRLCRSGSGWLCASRDSLFFCDAWPRIAVDGCGAASDPEALLISPCSSSCSAAARARAAPLCAAESRLALRRGAMSQPPSRDFASIEAAAEAAGAAAAAAAASVWRFFDDDASLPPQHPKAETDSREGTTQPSSASHSPAAPMTDAADSPDGPVAESALEASDGTEAGVEKRVAEADCAEEGGVMEGAAGDDGGEETRLQTKNRLLEEDRGNQGRFADLGVGERSLPETNAEQDGVRVFSAETVGRGGEEGATTQERVEAEGTGRAFSEGVLPSAAAAAFGFLKRAAEESIGSEGLLTRRAGSEWLSDILQQIKRPEPTAAAKACEPDAPDATSSSETESKAFRSCEDFQLDPNEAPQSEEAAPLPQTPTRSVSAESPKPSAEATNQRQAPEAPPTSAQTPRDEAFNRPGETEGAKGEGDKKGVVADTAPRKLGSAEKSPQESSRSIAFQRNESVIKKHASEGKSSLSLAARLSSEFQIPKPNLFSGSAALQTTLASRGMRTRGTSSFSPSRESPSTVGTRASMPPSSRLKNAFRVYRHLECLRTCLRPVFSYGSEDRLSAFTGEFLCAVGEGSWARWEKTRNRKEIFRVFKKTCLSVAGTLSAIVSKAERLFQGDASDDLR